MQIGPVDGIVWVTLTTPTIHAVRIREGETLCGKSTDQGHHPLSGIVEESDLCKRCHYSLVTWGYIGQNGLPPGMQDEEVRARLYIRLSEIAYALTSQGITPSEQNVKRVALYLQNLARASAKAKLQEEKDWRFLLDDEESNSTKP